MGKLTGRKAQPRLCSYTMNPGAMCDDVRLYATVTTLRVYYITPQCYISFHLTSH